MDVETIIKEGASIYESRRRAEQHVSGNEQLLFDACAALKKLNNQKEYVYKPEIEQLQAENKELRAIGAKHQEEREQYLGIIRENKRLREALELKSYDLHLPGNNGGRKPAWCCSICGHKPHTIACVYGQALQEKPE